MHHEVLDKIDNINNYLDMGIKNYRLELFNENKQEIQELLTRFTNNIK